MIWTRVVGLFAFGGMVLCSGLITESLVCPAILTFIGAVWATSSVIKARKRRARLLAGHLDEPCLLCGAEDVALSEAAHTYRCPHCGYDSAQATREDVKHLVRWIESLSVAHRALGRTTGDTLESQAADLADMILNADKIPIIDAIPGLGFFGLELVGAAEDVEEDRQRAIMDAREALQELLLAPTEESDAATGDRFLLSQLALALHVHAPEKEEQLLKAVIAGTLEALKQTLRRRLAPDSEDAEEARPPEEGLPQPDDDRLLDGAELSCGADRLDEDTEDDVLSDGDEVIQGSDPDDRDSNNGLDDGDEQEDGSDPLDANCDSDGQTDGEEVLIHGSDPLLADSGADGITDGEEVDEVLLAPTSADTNADEALKHKTDALDADSDDGGKTDGEETCDDHVTAPLDGNDDASAQAQDETS